MLFKNDSFLIDGVRMRLLHSDSIINIAWCVSIDDELAWPVSFSITELQHLEAIVNTEIIHAQHSEARLKKCNEAWSRLEPLLVAHGTNLFDPHQRNFLISQHAKKVSCSAGTLRKDLRRYWQRGQSKLALLPDYNKSGRVQEKNSSEVHLFTAGRGRKSQAGQSAYQLTSKDLSNIKRIIERHFLTDSRISVVDAHVEIVKEHFTYRDGNMDEYVNPVGSYPSVKQIRYFINKNYDIEMRLRGRAGDSDFEREHRKVLGTVLADCLGVGHYYEIDATIVDIFLVARDDTRKIIGKPTLYLIIDRKSRLIVGFYFGLENASWNAALQAILSISENKRDLCSRYGVDFDPNDWPAHTIFPQEFLADRGDMISHASTNIAQELQVTVTNLPSKRPDWKPLVECGFRMIHNMLRPVAPAYDPPSNATKRRGKHYQKDASLTMKDFGNLIVNAIIHHNKKEILNYDLTPSELLAGVRPSPIDLWNHGIQNRSGILTRFSEKTVRFALLRKEIAVVSEHGVEFRGCYYSFPEAIERKWFETARSKRFKINVSYDPRLVDQIYVHRPDGKGEPYLASLTDRSKNYSGLSFDETRYLLSLRKTMRIESEHQRLENSVSFRKTIAPVTESSKAQLKAAGPISRSGRKADTKPAREKERSLERQEQARIQQPTCNSNTPDIETKPSAIPLVHSTQAHLDAVRARMMA